MALVYCSFSEQRALSPTDEHYDGLHDNDNGSEDSPSSSDSGGGGCSSKKAGNARPNRVCPFFQFSFHLTLRKVKGERFFELRTARNRIQKEEGKFSDIMKSVLYGPLWNKVNGRREKRRISRVQVVASRARVIKMRQLIG